MSEQTKVASEHAAVSAFPWSRQTEHDTVVHCSGMTLRDYFAAKAMAAQLTATSADRDYADVDWVRDVGGPSVAERLASMSYRMADAMLAARGDA